jgi:RNA polymerase sigma factor (sigma-70 family)
LATGFIKSGELPLPNQASALRAPSGDNVVPLPRRKAAAPDYPALLAAIAAGDRSAENELLKALAGPLEVVLRHRAKGVEGVDDLRQEALVVVLQAAREGRLNDPAALIQYALQTARMLAVNAQRKLVRQRTDQTDDMDDLPALHRNTTSEDPNRASQQDELKRHIKTVLSSMPDVRERRLLHSYYLEEQSTVQLQAQYSLDSAQLGKILFRARRQFRRVWQSLNFESP